jgi:hypothetical protein
LTQQGVENPYDKFRGRLAPFVCARSKLIDLGDISLYSQSTSEVTQRAMRDNNQDSNKGDKENDALTNTLGTKE